MLDQVKDMTTERERFEAWLAQFRELAPLHGPVLWEAWQAALSAPPGYALVPVEPTDEMIDATYHGQPLADIWHDMIAAAPSAKEQTP